MRAEGGAQPCWVCLDDSRQSPLDDSAPASDSTTRRPQATSDSSGESLELEVKATAAAATTTKMG